MCVSVCLCVCCLCVKREHLGMLSCKFECVMRDVYRRLIGMGNFGPAKRL